VIILPGYDQKKRGGKKREDGKCAAIPLENAMLTA
jgi:hypothetical protein